jgi:hypothetical protein
MSVPKLYATDPTLSMVGWRYHMINQCPAIHVPAKLGVSELSVVMIDKDQLITVTNGPFNGAKWVDITWHLKPFMMFTEHLRNCGRRLGVEP